MSSRYDAFAARLHADREALLAHPLYASIENERALARFMEHHVFAVWDFMSLLKALQRATTCVDVPWLPAPDARAARFVNEMVLAEESDLLPDGSVRSHFELYLAAMNEVGASTGAIEAFVTALRSGRGPTDALASASAPSGAARFVESTLAIAKSGEPSAIAASFLFGREDLVPAMFRRFLPHLPAARTTSLRLYLERHVELDEGEHGPLARKLLVALCGDDADRWTTAEAAARTAIGARVALWDAALALSR